MSDPAKQWREATAKKIACAVWGHAENEEDVTEKIRAAVANGNRTTATVKWLGDPDKGQYKTLRIQVEDGERRETYTVSERGPLPTELFNPPSSAKRDNALYDQLDFIYYMRDAGEFLEQNGFDIPDWIDAISELTILIARLKLNPVMQLYERNYNPTLTISDIKKTLGTRQTRDRLADACQSVNPVVSAKPILNWLKRLISEKAEKIHRTRGRPALSQEDADERMRIVEAWVRAKGAGVTQKHFCKDEQISVKTLEKYVNWHTKRRMRKA